ncbi:MAG TPA: M23 family metallopeptidase [Stellaceae bacterium]|nr:M23 family metallopeptidase [Stellaceae bacterium]
MSSLVSAYRAIVRPISVSVLLVASLHLAVGALALRALVHPVAPHPAAVVAKPAAATKPTATVAQAAPAVPPKPAPKTVEAEPLRGHATILDPVLLARENAGLAQLRAAGVNLETLLHHAAPAHRTDEGGPLVPLAAIRDAALDPSRLAQLEQLIARMPFAAPLLHYAINSPFGIRRDPFNGERAFHPGIDLEAEYGEAVYTTAPGIVDFAGVDGAYGRMIEISHGNGIQTRYAHLSRILVRVGDRVDEHQRIGLVGSTGRSTGPHLHYEVRIDGRPLNPAKFLAVGRRSSLIAIDAAQ